MMNARGYARAVAMLMLAGLSLGGARAGEPVVLSDAQLDAVTAGGLVMELSGEASAVGESTLTDGQVKSRVVDKRKVTIGVGKATFSATGQSSHDETAFASADTSAAVAGADLVIMKTKTNSGSGVAGDQTWATETSQTRVFAVDVKGLELPNGPIVIDKTVAKDKARYPGPIEKNVATLNVDAKVRGTNTLVSADSSALTTSRFSRSSAVVVTGAN